MLSVESSVESKQLALPQVKCIYIRSPYATLEVLGAYILHNHFHNHVRNGNVYMTTIERAMLYDVWIFYIFICFVLEDTSRYYKFQIFGSYW